MTKTAAAALTSVLVPYFAKSGKYQKVETYRVTRVRGGFIVKGPRGEYLINQHPDGYLICPCEGYAWSIERNGEDFPAFCRHLCLIAAAHIMIAEIRSEATQDQPVAIECDFCDSTGTLTSTDGYQEPCDMCEGGTIQPTAETYAAKMAAHKAIGQQMVADLESIKVKLAPVAYAGTMIDFDPFVDVA